MADFKNVYFLMFFFAFSFAGTTTVSAQENSPTETVRKDSREILCSAQTIFIRTKTAYFKPAALEQTLLDRQEFQDWGFVISREESDADLIIEVDRKLFTNIFVYSVIDPKNRRIMLAGKIGSLGGTIENQIASGFIKRLERIRPLSVPIKTK